MRLLAHPSQSDVKPSLKELPLEPVMQQAADDMRPVCLLVRVGALDQRDDALLFDVGNGVRTARVQTELYLLQQTLAPRHRVALPGGKGSVQLDSENQVGALQVVPQMSRPLDGPVDSLDVRRQEVVEKLSPQPLLDLGFGAFPHHTESQDNSRTLGYPDVVIVELASLLQQVHIAKKIIARERRRHYSTVGERDLGHGAHQKPLPAASEQRESRSRLLFVHRDERLLQVAVAQHAAPLRRGMASQQVEILLIQSYWVTNQLLKIFGQLLVLAVVKGDLHEAVMDLNLPMPLLIGLCS